MRDRARERLVPVAIAENAAAAQLIQDELRAAGIRSLLKNRDAAAALGATAAVPFSFEVYVLEGDADAASALLGGDPAPPGLPPPALDARPRTRRRWWW